MYLEKDLPIIGRIIQNKCSKRLLGIATKHLLDTFSKPRSFPWQSEILDAKGIPFSKGGCGKITFRRYNKFET